MYAIEYYIMSRYQMYWQVYFHPVTRSSEVILTKIFHRAKRLYEMDYQFKLEPSHFISFFKQQISLVDYLKFVESIMNYYFQLCQDDVDPILSDLCVRFVNKRLVLFIEYFYVDSANDLEHL